MATLVPKQASTRFPSSSCGQIKKTAEYNLQKRPRLFFFWLNDLAGLDTVLLSLRQTITQCPDYIEPGYYHPENMFVYLFESIQGENNTSLLEQLFADKEVRRHKHVTALASLPSSRGLLVNEYNIYQSKRATVRVWKKDKPFHNRLELFTPFPMQVCLRIKVRYHPKVRRHFHVPGIYVQNHLHSL